MAFSYKASITVDHNQVPNTDQSGFPLLVSGVFDGTGGEPDLRSVGNGGHVQNGNGYDIHFYADTDLTARLPAEREIYNASTGEIACCVKVDLLTATDVTVWIAYGDASIAADPNSDATYGKTQVWDADFEAVWHLGDGTTIDASDSTGHARHGTNNGADPAPGKVGGGADFETSHQNDAIAVGNWSIAGDQMSFSAWIKLEGAADDGRFFSKATDWTEQGHVWMFGHTTNGGYEMLRLRLKTGYSDTGGTTTHIAGSHPLTLGVWHHVGFIYDGSYLRGFVDGQEVTWSGGTYSKTGPLRENAWEIELGNNPGTAYPAGVQMDGVLDEARVSRIRRSNDWFATEFNNQNSPGTFFSVGSETPVGDGGTTHQLTGYAGGASLVAGTLTAQRALLGAAQGQAPGVAALFVRRTLAGTAMGGSTGLGQLAGQRALRGALTGESEAAGTLAVQRTLAGSATGAASASGLLKRLLALTGSIAGASTATGVLEVLGAALLQGIAAGTSAGTATLSILRGLSGAVTGTSEATGSFSALRKLAGVAAGTATSAALLGVRRALAGVVAGTSSATGMLAVSHAVLVAGIAAGASACSAALSVVRRLSGAPSGTAEAAGGLSLMRGLAGGASATSFGAGSLGVQRALGGVVAGASWLWGILTGRSADLADVRYLDGTFRVSRRLEGSSNTVRELAGVSNLNRELQGNVQ